MLACPPHSKHTYWARAEFGLKSYVRTKPCIANPLLTKAGYSLPAAITIPVRSLIAARGARAAPLPGPRWLPPRYWVYVEIKTNSDAQTWDSVQSPETLCLVDIALISICAHVLYMKRAYFRTKRHLIFGANHSEISAQNRLRRISAQAILRRNF